MNKLLEHLHEFSVNADKGVTNISIESVAPTLNVTALGEILEDMDLPNLSLRFPLDKITCDFPNAREVSQLPAKIRQITIELDQFDDETEFGLFLDIERLGIAMRRPKTGFVYLDAENFMSDLLSVVSADTYIEFTLFDVTNAGPQSRSRRLPREVQSDIEMIDDIFAGFKNYQSCKYQKRMRRLIG